MDWKPQSTLIVILSPRICGLSEWKGGNEEKEVFGIGLAGRGDGFRELRERRTL